MIRFIIDIYILVIIADVVLSYLPEYRHKIWSQKINQIAGFTVKPVRRILPDWDLPFDPSPLFVILGLQLFIFLFLVTLC